MSPSSLTTPSPPRTTLLTSDSSSGTQLCALPLNKSIHTTPTLRPSQQMTRTCGTLSKQAQPTIPSLNTSISAMTLVMVYLLGSRSVSTLLPITSMLSITWSLPMSIPTVVMLLRTHSPVAAAVLTKVATRATALYPEVPTHQDPAPPQDLAVRLEQARLQVLELSQKPILLLRVALPPRLLAQSP
jgi:hypothetical protein